MAAGAAGMAVANRKVDRATRRQRWLKYATYVLITGIVIAGIYFHFFSWLSLFIAAASLVELIRVTISLGRRNGTVRIAFLIFLPVAAGFIGFAHLFQASFLLFIYFQVLLFDGFCQVTGQLWGRHPLFPAVSPGKTVEGLIGGWACCIIAAMLAAGWVNIPVTTAAGYGLLTGLTSFGGDSLSSFYKRRLRIKDYSNWLPGQGGFLDRFDSLLLTGFIYYIVYFLISGEAFSGFMNTVQ